MAKRVIWSPAALNDLENILDYLNHNWSETIVNKFINNIDDNIGLIIEDPIIFPLINDELKIRKSVITKHNTLFYRETSSEIQIIRLFDSRQDPKKLVFK
jgi:plasmid stabilization system protein ParE